jgi:hypothetical protein
MKRILLVLFIIFSVVSTAYGSRIQDQILVDVEPEAFKNVDVQYPLPTDGDSVYAKDVDVDWSDSTGWTGTLTDIFGDLMDGITYTGTDSPKDYTVYFNRTVVTNAAGFGADMGNFSNLKLTGILSGGSQVVLYDGSTDSVDRTSQTIQFTPLGVIGFLVEFYTTDDVTITNMVVLKTITTVSRIEAQKDDGTVTPIGATDSGNLKTTDAENGLAIAKGDVSGTTFEHKFGNAPDFDSTDLTVTVWDGAEDGTAWENMVYDYSTTADIDSISSSNAGDTQEITVVGQDINYNIVTQTKNLNGQTRVALDTPLFRCYRAYNSNATNLVGHVFVYVNGATTGGVPNNNDDIRAIIDPINQQTEMAIYTVPAGKTGYMRSWYAATAGASKNANYFITLRSREATRVFRVKHTSALNETGTSAYQHTYVEPEVFPEKTDIEMTVSILGTGVTAASVSAGFDMVLVDN